MRKDETTMKRGKKGLVLAGALLLTMFALTGCGKTKINLNDYVEVNFSGYNTAGQAEINELKIRNDIILDHWETFGLTEEQHENEQAAANEDTRQFVESVSYSLDKMSGLQNGDAVTLQWNVQEKELDELAKKIKAEFVYSDMTFTVEGLEEPEDWDPFEGTEINYRGKLRRARTYRDLSGPTPIQILTTVQKSLWTQSISAEDWKTVIPLRSTSRRRMVRT